MANGLDLKERNILRDIPENDPLMELSRIMGFDQPVVAKPSVDPQTAAEDSFSMDLERELAFEEIPLESRSFDADFAAAFEDDLSDALRFEPDAPSVVPSLEDELSALLSEPAFENHPVTEFAAAAEPYVDTTPVSVDAEVASLSGSYFDQFESLENDLENTDELPAAELVEWRDETVSAATEPVFPWPEVTKDDSLESEIEALFQPEVAANAAPEPVHHFDDFEDGFLVEPEFESEAVQAHVAADEVIHEPNPTGNLASSVTQPFALEDYVAFDSAQPPVAMDLEPVTGDSEYAAEDGFDAFRELAALDVPPAPEFADWSPAVAAAPVEAQLIDETEYEDDYEIERPVPLVEASEPKRDEVLPTDDFEIPDFEFQSLNDAAQNSHSYDEFADAIEVAETRQITMPMPAKTPFDETEFDFDSLINEELAVATAGAATGAAAMSMRAKPSMHVDADSDYDPFQRTAIADDVFAPIAEPAGRKPWLVPVVLAGALALLGGGIYYVFSGGNPSATAEGPALVKADPEPVKVAPENPGGATVANQDKAVYDKVGGDQSLLPAQGALVSESEEPVDIAAVTPPAEPEAPMQAASPVEAETTAKAEDRVETPAVGEAQAPAAETAAVMPKKVRTVIVKPDGTLVERPVEAAAAAVTEPVAEIAATESSSVASIAPVAEPEAIAAAPVPVAKPVVAVEEPAIAAPVVEDPIAQIAAVEPEPAKVAEPAPAAPVAAESQPEPVAAEPAIKVVKTKKIKAPAAEEVAAAPAAPADAAPFGERPADQPVNIVGQTGGQNTAAETQVASANPAPSGAYSIQIASTPSPEAAKSTYAALSRKFGGVIGGKGVNIQKANVEGKGTVYRVRIPAGSKQDATALCSQYKSAGGSCFVTR